MQITVTCPNTVFGTIVKTFTTENDAMEWVKICIDNDLKVIIEK